MQHISKSIFPPKGHSIRLAMLGMIPGNGHPYSWSSIINGYRKEELLKCPYPAIPEYMEAQSESSSGIEGVTVSHIWTDNPEEGPKVAAAARIPNVLNRPEDVIGEVDAVIIATDDGDNHVSRARPFIEAGLPVFIDKPLATNDDDLEYFVARKKEGHFIMSCSGMRFAPELKCLKDNLPELGELRWISCTTIKDWESYGIHALESVFQITGPGFVSIRMEVCENQVVAFIRHSDGYCIAIPVIPGAAGSFGVVQACGTVGYECIQLKDTYRAFRDQLLCFVSALRSGKDEIPFSDTVEMMKVIMAGREGILNPRREIEICNAR